MTARWKESNDPVMRLIPIAAIILVNLAPTAQAQTGVSREAMWPAPTAEDWAKPCLIEWERSWDDALEVGRETGKPLLICVNMDGEIASEHYAGIRYRQDDITELYEPYVCVIASVYRHNPRDYDEQGVRIPCPRFGHVTCGEHIAIEPVLYGQYFDETRVAPRHIMIELDKSEQYDVFYAFDTQSVFDQIETGVQGRPAPLARPGRDDRKIEDRVDSSANADRTAVEQAYAAGDSETRRKLLRRAVQTGDRASVDLLRLAVMGFDIELARLGRQGLVLSRSEKAIDLIGQALAVPMAAGEREELVAALERLGEQFPRARTLSRVHRGLLGESGAIDAKGWSEALAENSSAPDTLGRDALESAIDYSAQVARSRPQDALAQLELAEATLAIAVDPRQSGGFRRDRRTAARLGKLLFEDARRAALEAERMGAEGWRVEAALALTAWYLGDREEGYARAEVAAKAIPPGAGDWNALAVLSLFADKRRGDITRALRAKEDWPSVWLTDLHAAYSVLAGHPYGTDAQIVDHVDFLNYMGAFAPASTLLGQGFMRFPDSPLLHDRLRGRILREKGVDGLEPTYEGQPAMLLEFCADDDDTTPLPLEIEQPPGGAPLVLDSAPLVRALLDGLDGGLDKHQLSAAFHAGLAHGLVRLCQRASRLCGVKDVALGGGCLQNRRLARLLHQGLERAGLRPMLPRRVPVNDGGLALGQVMVHAALKHEEQ